MARANRRVSDLVIEGAQINFRNFSGEEKQYNRAGDRNFCVFLDPELADRLIADGWNVKTTRVKEEGDVPGYYMQVAVKYNNFPPKIYMVTRNKKTLLSEETVGELDYVDIANVDLIINPYPYTVSGRTGIKAYCKTMYVTIKEDVFASKYSDDNNFASLDDEEVF